LVASDLHGAETRTVTKKSPHQAENNGNDEAHSNSHADDYSTWHILNHCLANGAIGNSRDRGKDMGVLGETRPTPLIYFITMVIRRELANVVPPIGKPGRRKLRSLNSSVIPEGIGNRLA
jgi:hypothetical protein